MLDLETLMLSMTAYGRPSVGLFSSGWHCSVDMNVGAAGVGCTVRSEFNHLTPLEAAQVCIDRIRAIGASQVRERGIAAETARIDHG